MADKKPSRVVYQKMTWAHAFRDIIVNGMNKGQLLPILFFIIVLVILLRLSSEDMMKMIENLLIKMADLSALGYALFVVSLIGWYSHARWLNKKFGLAPQG